MDADVRAGNGGIGGDGYRFGPFVVDTGAYTLTRDGEPQALEPKAFAVLLHLLRHAGELVRHDDLLDAVWGHRHVTPGVLTRAIAQLRHVLEDDSHRPQYIQTQHGLGYRFIGELKSWPPREPSAREPGASAAEPAGVHAAAAMETGTPIVLRRGISPARRRRELFPRAPWRCAPPCAPACAACGSRVHCW